MFPDLVDLHDVGMLQPRGRFSFSAKEREAFIAEGRRVFTDKNCHGCHTTGPVGTPIAPDLRETAVRYTEAALARWLQNPSAQVPTRHMPDLHLSKAEANAVAAYIALWGARGRRAGPAPDSWR